MLEEKAELRDRLSGAIRELEAEGMIGILGRDFITGPKVAKSSGSGVRAF